MDYCTVKADLFGAMESSTKASLQITELQDTEFTDGPMEACMKDKSKMDWDMAQANISLSKPLTKDSGLKAKSLEKVRSFSKVEAFSKDLSKMTWSKAMAKCTTILQETISKGSGKTTRNKEKEQWIGPISEKSMSESGKIIIKKDGACTFGLSLKDRVNTLETDTKVNG